MIAARGQTVPNLVEVVAKVDLKVLQSLVIHTGATLVGPNPFVGLIHQALLDGKWFCRVPVAPPGFRLAS